MKKILIPIYYILTILAMVSCVSPEPNTNKEGEDELKSLEVDRQINEKDMIYQDVIYIPIYSDIYVDEQNQNTLLAATLSIRNTSHGDSLFISRINYFNTKGDLVRNYIDKAISIPPMGTLNYVIEKDDDTGGTGANFIVELSADNKNVKPLIQAVMIGQIGNKGFSFSTDGYSIK